MIRKAVNGMHTPNGIALHKRQCGGKLTKTINSKPIGDFELWKCEKPSCNYAGRGKQVAPAPQVIVDVDFEDLEDVEE